MLYRVIEASEIPALISAFMESHEVVAPVKKGDVYAFDVISSPDEVVLDYDTTIASPKKYFLPPAETLMTFDAQGNQLTDYTAEITPRVIFGAHACDINALNRLDVVYKDAPYADPYYIARRQATLIVGISCMPTETCFCHLWSSDEARFGYDLFLQDIGGKYLVSISSNDAANILESACNPREATDAERIEFRHATRRRQAAFNPQYLLGATQLWDANRLATGWDPKTVEVTLTLEGYNDNKPITMDLKLWDACLEGLSTDDEGREAPYNFFNADMDIQLQILAAEETAILEQYWAIPVYSSTAASLMSYKCEYISYEYNTFMGFGGIQYMSYNFDDTEWEAFVEADSDGILNYTF